VIGSSYWRSELYNYLGDVLDLGDPGQFDDTWGASFCLRKIGETYYGLYEAKDSKGVFSIGMTSTDSVTNLPYTKLGPAKNSTGQVIYNPNGKDEAIIPDTFTTENICYLHYDTLQGEEETWNSRLLIGDFPENNLSLSLSDLHPIDPFDNHNNIANIGEISGRYTFLMQSWNQSMKNRKLHLYMEEPIVESFESITFIGTLHFEDTNISPNMVGVAIKVVTEGECIAETRNITKTGKFYIPIKTLGKYKRKYDFTIYSQTDETSKENKTITIQIIGPPLSGTGITIEKDSKIEKIYLIYITIFMIISYYIIKYLYLNE
jgi:hypothetical protein